MNKVFTVTGLALRIWLITALTLSMVLAVFFSYTDHEPLIFIIIFFAGSLILSLPAFVSLLIVLPALKRFHFTLRNKIAILVSFIALLVSGYGFVIAVIDLNLYERIIGIHLFAAEMLISSAVLFLCVLVSLFILHRPLRIFFTPEENRPLYKNLYSSNTTTIMDDSFIQAPVPAAPNRLLVKGLITGGLILLMWIPTLFIQNLITEREMRQQEIVKEVSAKWANAQTVSGPFLTIPYTETQTDPKGNYTIKTQLIVSADKLEMNGKIIPEERPRSIYKVLLYRTALHFAGSFKPQWPADINPANLDLTHARLCFSLSDYKGIEDEVTVNLNGQNLQPEPGMPVTDLGPTGLSVPVNLSIDSLTAGIPFSMNIKIKGSGQLHFIPMSVSSKYILSSSWADPSFDGNVLPTERSVKDSGFISQWNFNKANAAFGAVIRAGNLPAASGSAFGVSLVQPADQYNKTMRCVKYAILFIGLTFALFFIIEIMQKKPFHPVQYVLVGMALVIFYTLLLSISEFILFDHAYLISAAATVLLIFFYAKGHFKSWRSAGILAALLGSLYGFIFILIRLEDTALLVGSIGLFLILALVMFASRKINWYGTTLPHEKLNQQ